MNCTRCNEPLPPGARFCRNCGAPVTQAFQTSVPASPQQQYYQPTVPTVPTIPEIPQSTDNADQAPQALAARQYMPAAALPQRRRRPGRRLRITLITLAVLIVVLVGAWIFVLRPYLHSMAQDQLDPALSSAVNQIDLSLLNRLPAGVPVPLRVTEDEINNFYLPLVHVPSSPVQNMHMQITSNELRLDFNVYGFASDITGRPTLVNGNITITNVSVGGIVGLVMSSDEMTKLLNKHIADIQARLHRPVNEVVLLDHELDIVLG